MVFLGMDAVPELILNDDEFVENQSKAFETMRGSPTISFGLRIDKKDILSLIQPTRRFKLGRGPDRNRMIERARKMRTNYISTYTFRKEGDEFVDERGAFRLILQ